MAMRRNGKGRGGRGARSAAEAPMSAAEARTFDGISTNSAAQVLIALDERKETGIYPDCACEPYEDTFTFERWKAQGKQVRRGEKALRISSWIAPKRRGERDDANGDDNSSAPRQHPATDANGSDD